MNGFVLAMTMAAAVRVVVAVLNVGELVGEVRALRRAARRWREAEAGMWAGYLLPAASPVPVARVAAGAGPGGRLAGVPGAVGVSGWVVGSRALSQAYSRATGWREAA